MSNKLISSMLKGLILCIGAIGVIICALWYPFSVSLFTIGLTPSGEIPLIRNIAFWLQIVFYWGCSLPCFVILCISWRISTLIRRDKAFSRDTVRLLNKSAKILFIDLTIYFIGNAFIMRLGLNGGGFIYLYLLLILLGVGIAFFISALAHFTKRATELKEEVEGTI